MSTKSEWVRQGHFYVQLFLLGANKHIHVLLILTCIRQKIAQLLKRGLTDNMQFKKLNSVSKQLIFSHNIWAINAYHACIRILKIDVWMDKSSLYSLHICIYKGKVYQLGIQYITGFTCRRISLKSTYFSRKPLIKLEFNVSQICKPWRNEEEKAYYLDCCNSFYSTWGS